MNVCKLCGKQTVMGNRDKKFCSRPCKNTYYRKFGPPNPLPVDPAKVNGHCSECGTGIIVKRKDHLFCGNLCRKRHNGRKCYHRDKAENPDRSAERLRQSRVLRKAWSKSQSLKSKCTRCKGGSVDQGYSICQECYNYLKGVC